MPAHKNQHYVSQCCLRNFTRSDSDNLICLYHIPSRRYVSKAAIKNQACGDYFYEKGVGIEQELCKIEGSVMPLIRDAIKNEVVPKWGSQDYRTLVKFVVLQHSRTQCAADEMWEEQEKMRQKIGELFPGAFPKMEQEGIAQVDVPRMLVELAQINVHVCGDLRSKILRNRTSIPFITSDHPVVLYNQLYEEPDPIMSNTGLACRGIQVFLPLNPRYVLVLFDSDVYKVGGRNFRVTCVDATEDDVRTLNFLQFVNAGEHIYFDDLAPENYIEQLARDAVPFLRKEKGVVRTGPAVANGKEHGTIVAMSRVDIQIGLDLQCMAVLPSAKKYQSRDPRVRFRAPELIETLHAFSRKVAKKEMSPDQFSQFVKSLGR
jgi:hypothetical protein